LDYEFVKRIIHASYAGVFIDEYQDCSVSQHELVLALSSTLPCRVLGDPLQGIFEFDDPIDWERHIAPVFDFIGALETPHRWKNAGTPQIGEWLKHVRAKLDRNESIDLTDKVPKGVLVKLVDGDDALTRKQHNICSYFRCEDGHRVIAIHKGTQEFKEKCHRLARNLAGAFASIEEIEGNALFSFFGKLDRARTNSKRLKEVVSFAAKCMTAVSGNLSAATRRGESTQIRENTKNPDIASKANAYLGSPSAANMNSFLGGLAKVSGIRLFRRDLFNRALGVLRKHSETPDTTFLQATEKYHGEFRYRGRPVAYPKLIGTTLLVKGLEFDHAIVLDASSLSKKELYVAPTRGAKSITIVSSSRFVPGGSQPTVSQAGAG
jgi:DNA helicase-2/ATP-dependent DNA helicase PcrA